MSSLPLWECGLKCYYLAKADNFDLVTPLVGVWIEIVLKIFGSFVNVVTPLVGVWIEILTSVAVCLGMAGHSPCGSVD